MDGHGRPFSDGVVVKRAREGRFSLARSRYGGSITETNYKRERSRFTLSSDASGGLGSIREREAESPREKTRERCAVGVELKRVKEEREGESADDGGSGGGKSGEKWT